MSDRADSDLAIGSRGDAGLIATLLRSTLLGLRHADLTGNHTVLRDLGSPSFRGWNTEGDLAAAFAELRAGDLDLETVAILTQRLTRPPTIEGNRMLAVGGTFDTMPVTVDFDLIFELMGRSWRLFDLPVMPLKPSAR